MSTTTYAHGAVAAGPVRKGQRTAADLLADMVSLAVLLALGCFGIAVSFSHTMEFVRQHGQERTWIVVGTALTVVGLTVQSGMEVYRDSRAGRGRGWPAILLGVGVVAELYANASTAHGGLMNRTVAAWPVPVAAAALALWTRRLQHAAEAAERDGRTVAAKLWDLSPEQRVEVAELYRAEQLVHDGQEDEPDPLADDLAAAGTAKERALLVLGRMPEVPGPAELGRRAGCTRQYAATVLNEWRARPENQPGQESLDIPGVLAA